MRRGHSEDCPLRLERGIKNEPKLQQAQERVNEFLANAMQRDEAKKDVGIFS